MAVKKYKEILNSKGQSIVEFLLFLPFMLMMYSVTLSLSNSINASINQQKIARSFWYYRNMNNSTIPRPRRDGGAEPSDSWRIFGMQIMGWAKELRNGETPVAPCFKFNLPLGGEADDECGSTYSKETTQFIRVQTVYGMCGATYVKDNNNNIPYPRNAAVSGGSEIQHCSIVE